MHIFMNAAKRVAIAGLCGARECGQYIGPKRGGALVLLHGRLAL